MIEISKHIETLLLTNDCVIVPRLGGFVAHHVASTYVADEHLFLPPSRIIGFNPQLKMNDGLLVQSFMSVYGNSFSDASKMIDGKVDEILDVLHKEGCLHLPNIGELQYNIHDRYHFKPYDNRLVTPYLYGLDGFTIKPLSELHSADYRQPASVAMPASTPNGHAARYPIGHRRQWGLRIRQASVAASMLIVILLSFFFSTPIANTEVSPPHCQAGLMPDNLLNEWQKRSLAFTAIGHAAPAPQATPTQPVVESTPTAPPAEVAAINPPASTAHASAPSAPAKKRYHVIVASVATEQDAYQMAETLKSRGHTDAQAIIGNGKMRVSIASYTTQAEAGKVAEQLRQADTHPGAWVLKK